MSRRGSRPARERSSSSTCSGPPRAWTSSRTVADRHGIPIIEDCAQAFGASYQGQGVGGIGATGVYSFNEYKTITCGDGGMIVTDDEELYGRLFAIHDQGHARTASARSTPSARSSA